ncbi:unnamed protein product [Tilletia controversa]|uniref:DUF6604 domain-containing protein n=3 Tax=Tilletia TaxID=13289 RepID=A0A8X7MXL7_9BASI|nr:hypothetical protein CF336_g5292 [Tilletia laevis]KAE8194561.1 hypothetical protein CF328_g4704 [Tilletia controversa]KAE8257874.1 hypothetical protein A4X03_0g4537 [Tilletia caries]KAE8197634.1 hypothetical protein CF335_g4565 [Tilletia laevis]KAE8252063.1 hypothetical protein A4X06_0g2438 [Tilletia controversa]
MRQRDPHEQYLQYKRDTLEIETWLAKTAVRRGFPIHGFKESVRSQLQPADVSHEEEEDTGIDSFYGVEGEISHGELAPVANDSKLARRQSNATKKIGKKLSKQEHLVNISQFIKIAVFLAKRKVKISTRLHRVLCRCIKLRTTTATYFWSKPGWSRTGHMHFLKVLRNVLTILTTHRRRSSLMKMAAAPRRSAHFETSFSNIPTGPRGARRSGEGLASPSRTPTGPRFSHIPTGPRGARRSGEGLAGPSKLPTGPRSSMQVKNIARRKSSLAKHTATPRTWEGVNGIPLQGTAKLKGPEPIRYPTSQNTAEPTTPVRIMGISSPHMAGPERPSLVADSSSRSTAQMAVPERIVDSPRPERPVIKSTPSRTALRYLQGFANQSTPGSTSSDRRIDVSTPDKAAWTSSEQIVDSSTPKTATFTSSERIVHASPAQQIISRLTDRTDRLTTPERPIDNPTRSPAELQNEEEERVAEEGSASNTAGPTSPAEPVKSSTPIKTALKQKVTIKTKRAVLKPAAAVQSTITAEPRRSSRIKNMILAGTAVLMRKSPAPRIKNVSEGAEAPRRSARIRAVQERGCTKAGK